MSKIDIKSYEIEELENFLVCDLNQPKFRAKQIFDWLHKKRVSSFEDMKNIPQDLIYKLNESCYITNLVIKNKLVSKIDSTVKYLYMLDDGEYIESVLMKYKHGNSICVSSQVGCKMGCEFCASTKAGFVRNLKPSEILEQIYQTEKDLDVKVSNIVLMGIGEPLDNYKNVISFLRLINSPLGANISLRNISLSTCGIVNKINELSKLKLGITLSVSLHASEDAIRDKIMPINHRYNIKTLLDACKNYTDVTSRRISFEYALIEGENDSKEDAKRLANILKGQLCHVNLIPVNKVKETNFRQSSKKRIHDFQNELIKNGINTTVRRTLGADISAACGQLRRDNIE